MATVTCRTEGCINKDEPIEKDLDRIDDDGNPYQLPMTCGPCGQPITDIVTAAPR
jgi:hypothetical protein